MENTGSGSSNKKPLTVPESGISGTTGPSPSTSNTPSPKRIITGMSMNPSSHELNVRKIIKEVYHFEGWKMTVSKSPILPSHCYCTAGSVTIGKANSTMMTNDPENVETVPSPRHSEPGTLCQVCRFAHELALHHLPEMVFPDNQLLLTYENTGFTMNFNALDAMKLISTTSPPVHVYYSEEWKASKVESGLPVNQSNLDPYDWTYSTEYKGTIIDESAEITTGPEVQLNLDKLREQEKILFYEEIPLYEDELHDNGISTLTVKLRVMPSGFFILLRHFLRVDHVLAKLCDTRIHYEAGNNWFIRQYQVREEKYGNLGHLQPHTFTDPNILYSHLPIINESTEKISLGPAPAPETQNS